MRYIFHSLIIAFIFVGCYQKPTVDIKQEDSTYKEEDKTSKIEKFPSNETMIEEKIIELKKDGDTFFDTKSNKLNIAFIYPSELVSKYAKSSINTVVGYFSFLEQEYNLVAIDSVDESYESIQNALNRVKDSKIDKVIALFTPNAIDNLKQIDDSNLKIYFPLIEKREFNYDNENFIFGSISYKEQLKKLSFYSEGDNILFYQDTYLGNKLKNNYEELELFTDVKKGIRRNETNFKNFVDDDRLNDSFVFLNLDIVKSSLVLSQLRANEKEPKIIFATQVLFDPVLLTLTQEKDRERLLIANSIEKTDDRLKDTILNFGGNITYEWVDYSTLVGINYFINGNSSDIILTKIVDNEAIYIPKLYISTAYGFVEIK